MHSAEERWIQWWCAPWQWAHPDWTSRFLECSGLPPTDLADLMRVRPAAFLQGVGIAPSQPPPPVDALLQWLALDADGQRQALNLAGRICLLGPAQSEAANAPDSVPGQHETWCRSVARALRPGTWLDVNIDDPRLVLASWIGETCWPRLRLSWPPDSVPQTVAHLPSNKLQTLWQAVLWRVMTP
jgi:hypothetical protein